MVYNVSYKGDGYDTEGCIFLHFQHLQHDAAEERAHQVHAGLLAYENARVPHPDLARRYELPLLVLAVAADAYAAFRVYF